MSRQYEQKFRTAWLKDPLLKDWLVSVESTVGTVAKCRFCGVQLTSRYADLKNHGQSKKHKKSAALFLGPLPQRTISFPRNTELFEAKRAECNFALFVSQHIAISTIDHLINVCKSSFPKSTGLIKLHRTKCSAIIKNVLGPYFTNDLREDIGDNKFSLLLDESTDIKIIKYLGIVIIYYSNKQKQVISSFLELASLEGSTADDIVTSIKSTLRKHNLSLDKLVAIGTDNAVVMTGVNNGVYQKLKDEVPHLILIRCVCHSLQLAVSAAAKEFLPRNLEFLIQETYNWFSKSSLRQAAYNQIYNILNENNQPLKIVQASNTRWLSIETAVARILEQWLELKTHFQIAKQDEKCFTAHLLHQMYEDDVNYAFLVFLKPILTDCQKVNKLFESNDYDPSKLFNSLIFLFESLVTKVCIPHKIANKNLMEVNIEDCIDNNCYLRYNFENKIREMRVKGLSQESDDNIRRRCIQFVSDLIKQIKIRLPDNIQILRNISFFCVEDALKAQKMNVIPILEEFGKPNDLIEKIDNQWKTIHLIKWTEIHDTRKFWTEVINYQNEVNDNPFKELSDFAIELLILPQSNAEVERLFSTMNLVKSKIRNSMQLPMLSAILSIRGGLRRHGKCCDNFTVPDNVIEKIKTAETYTSHRDDDLHEIDFDNIL